MNIWSLFGTSNWRTVTWWMGSVLWWDGASIYLGSPRLLIKSPCHHLIPITTSPKKLTWICAPSLQRELLGALFTLYVELVYWFTVTLNLKFLAHLSLNLCFVFSQYNPEGQWSTWLSKVRHRIHVCWPLWFYFHPVFMGPLSEHSSGPLRPRVQSDSN